MFVCCDCCVLSGRGLCDELITRPEESYRLWCVVVCDPETSRMRRPWSVLCRSATVKKKVAQSHVNIRSKQIVRLKRRAIKYTAFVVHFLQFVKLIFLTPNVYRFSWNNEAYKRHCVSDTISLSPLYAGDSGPAVIRARVYHVWWLHKIQKGNARAW